MTHEEIAEGAICEEHDYEYTPENLVKLGIYDDIESAKEVCGYN